MTAKILSAGELCQSCGACCETSADWPRFTLESDEALDRIPAALVADNLSGMRSVDNRCCALHGKVGTATRCTIYDIRPDVCRACLPGDDACTIARQHHGMAPLYGLLEHHPAVEPPEPFSPAG